MEEVTGAQVIADALRTQVGSSVGLPYLVVTYCGAGVFYKPEKHS